MTDEYQKYLEEQKKGGNSLNKIIKNITGFHIGVFFGVLLIGNYLVSNGTINMSYFVGAIILSFVIIIFLLIKQPTERKEIPENVIKRIVYDKLEEKRVLGREIPFDCQIKVDLISEVIYENNLIMGDSGPIRRDVGFEIINRGYRKKGVVGINPFTGNIGGIRWEKMGYRGVSDNANRVIVPANVYETPEDKYFKGGKPKI